MRVAFSALACLFSLAALAAPPPAPQITVQATDIRQLEFDFEPVPGVQWYELWFQAAPGAPWVEYQERRAELAPRFRIGVGVHLLDWRRARYHVKACNPSGCSASNEVGVDGEQLTAMGFFKPGAANHIRYGGHVVLSEDGKTLAVVSGESSGSRLNSVVVHVYRRTTSSSGWRFEAKLAPTVMQAQTAQPFVGDPLAISRDGNLIALGVWKESLTGTNQSDDHGAVYLFRRAGSIWRMAQRIPGAPVYSDRFGYIVKLDHAGRTLVVWRGTHQGNRLPGTLEIYRDDWSSSDQFAHARTLPVPNDEGTPAQCRAMALSGDGATLLRACMSHRALTYVHRGWEFELTARIGAGNLQGLDVNEDGTVAIVQGSGSADVYRHDGTGWTFDDTLFSGLEGNHNSQHRRVALSRDGRIAVIGHAHETSRGVGPTWPPYEVTSPPSGGAIVYERKASGWVMRRLVKPGNTHEGWTGHAVALGDYGRVLALGAPADPSGATGIDGDRDNTSAPDRGAVWLY
jgi:trimeric autotransporter adhesin